MTKDIKDMLIERQQKQLDQQQELLNSSIKTLANVVESFQKTIKTVVLISGMVSFFIVASLFVSYFFSDYSEEIKQSHSNYNYNENINTNKTN